MKNFRPSLGYQNPYRSRFSETFFDALPTEPGVYFMRGTKGRILYVGKAKCLRDRLRSYRSAKPGQVGENVIELLERVRAIDWEVHPDEASAIRRELELIHALTPTYNVAACWEEDYLYVGLRRREGGVVDFRLTSDAGLGGDGYEYFGCFRNRRRTKAAYLALLRLLFAAANEKERFSFPARIARYQPPYEYTPRATVDSAIFSGIRAFFSGTDDGLLGAMIERLLENPTLPPFVRPGLQEDIDALRDFYAVCVRPNGAPIGRPITHRELRDRIRVSLRDFSRLHEAS